VYAAGRDGVERVEGGVGWGTGGIGAG